MRQVATLRNDRNRRISDIRPCPLFRRLQG